jgi:hypothetical protein
MEYSYGKLMKDFREDGINYLRKSFIRYMSSNEGYDYFWNYGDGFVNYSYISNKEDLVAMMSYLVLGESLKHKNVSYKEAGRRVIDKIPNKPKSDVEINEITDHVVVHFLRRFRLKANAKNIPELKHLLFSKP